MINHYAILGLSAEGLREDGAPYTEEDLRKAYKKRSLKVHPDRNAKAETAAAFQSLTQSYGILINPAERAIFDEQLRTNPRAFTESEHLFLTLETSEAEDEPFLSEETTDATALVPLRHKGIDLTQLILNADADPEYILKTATSDRQFCNALIANTSIFSTFPVRVQSKFILTANQHRVANSSDVAESFFQEHGEKETLSAFLAQVQTESGGHEFVSACLQEQALAKVFFKPILIS